MDDKSGGSMDESSRQQGDDENAAAESEDCCHHESVGDCELAGSGRFRVSGKREASETQLIRRRSPEPRITKTAVAMMPRVRSALAAKRSIDYASRAVGA
jgi:hypothetical protein